jgi:hypothetical protein
MLEIRRFWRQALEDAIRLIVRHGSAIVNDGPAKPHGLNLLKVSRQDPDGRHGEPINTAVQTAQIAAQQGREHVEAAIDEVKGGAPRLRFPVERRIVRHEIRNVGNVHAD